MKFIFRKKRKKKQSINNIMNTNQKKNIININFLFIFSIYFSYKQKHSGLFLEGLM